jgi:hypothetical protein
MGMVCKNTEAQVLPVKEVTQEQENWCWAACTEAVVEYLDLNNTNIDVQQCNLANDLRIFNIPPDNCCNYVDSGFPVPDYCNQPNWLLAEDGFLAVEDIFNNNSIQTQGVEGALSIEDITNDINAGFPFIIGLDDFLEQGAGHVVVGRGIESPFIFYMDPYPVDMEANHYHAALYDWIVSGNGHTWSESLRIKNGTVPSPPFADIRVNGISGTVYVNSYQNLNITASLNPQNYTDDADWWFMVIYLGQYYYMDSQGNWSLNETPFFQGEIGSLNNDQIYYGPLSPGTYYFYFGVDLHPDGVLNYPLYYDSITVFVQ